MDVEGKEPSGGAPYGDGRRGLPPAAIAGIAALGIAVALGAGAFAAISAQQGASGDTAGAEEPAAQPLSDDDAGKDAAEASEDAKADDPAGSSVRSEKKADSSAQGFEPATEDSESQQPSAAYGVVYAVDNVPAKTHEEDAPTYEDVTVTENRTVCNTCGAAVDGDGSAHLAATGHAGVTQNVPVSVTRTVEVPHKKTVEDEPAKWYTVCYKLNADGSRGDEVSRTQKDSEQAAQQAADEANAAAAQILAAQGR